MMKIIFFALIFSILIIPAYGQTEYLKVKPSDVGTLDVGIALIPDNPTPPEEVRFQIDFINPKTDKIQEHIDYKFTLQREGENVFGPTQLIHTSEGTVKIPVEIVEPGTYFALIEYEGILFQPIPVERVSFTIPIAEAQTNGEEPPPENGGCLIATATFGSELAPQVQKLREIRDNVVMKTESGSSFMTGFNQVYYTISPAIADLERQNIVFKEFVKMSITPMLTSLSILDSVEIDSEVEMLAYGISLILLNVGMYIGFPAVVITKWYKSRK